MGVWKIMEQISEIVYGYVSVYYENFWQGRVSKGK